MATVLGSIAGGRRSTELMVASHNQASIASAVAEMHRLGIRPRGCGVCFGQLLGMSDHLTFTLGRNGYRVRRPSDVSSDTSASLRLAGAGAQMN